MFSFLLFCAAAIFLSFLIFWFWGKSIVYPSGKKFEYLIHDEQCRAIVIADVPGYRGGFVVNGDKIDGKELACSCAFAMKAINAIAKTHGPEITRRSSGLPAVIVFNFVDDAVFMRRAKKAGFENPKQYTAFSTLLKNKSGNVASPIMPIVTIRYENMKAVLEKGSLAIHELVHIISYLVTGDWDYKEHKFWYSLEYLCDDGKNIDWLAKEYWRLEM